MKRRRNPKAVRAVRMAVTATNMWPRALLIVSVDHVATEHQLQGVFLPGNPSDSILISISYPLF